MATSQVKLLGSLAERLKSETKDRAQAVASLQSAKILTRKENFAGHYSHLQRIVTTAK